MNTTASRKMTQARSDLVLSDPFYGFIALRLEMVEDSTAPTLWTDGKRVGYNPSFIESIPQQQVRAELTHEVMHVAYLHPWRLDNRDHKVANEAADYAINILLHDDGHRLGKDWLLDISYRGQSFEEIYNTLTQQKMHQQQAQQKAKQQGQQQEEGAGKGQGQKSQDRQGEEQQGKSKGDSEDDDGQGDGASSGSSEGQASEGETESNKPVRSEVRPCTDPDSATQEAEMTVAVIQAAQASKSFGKLPGHAQQLIGKLRQSKVNWKEVTRRFIQQTASADYTWKQPAARYQSYGLYLPSLHSEQLPPIVLAIDASGSCWGYQAAFVSEMQSIMTETLPEKLVACFFDTGIQTSKEYAPNDSIDLKSTGAGGTDFRCIFDWIDKEEINPACLIVLTDLEGPFPDMPPSYPVLWVSTTQLVAPFGETVPINQRGL